MNRLALLLLLVSSLLVQAQAPAPATPVPPKTEPRMDTLLRAMVEEMQRATRLRILDPIYYIDYSVDDAEIYSASAVLGGLMRENKNRMRSLRTSVRVGSYDADNMNSIYSDYYSGARYDSDVLPLDDNLFALRHALWLSTDRAYKMASEALARKRSALRGVTTTDPIPDFSTGEASRVVVDAPQIKVDDAMWTARTKMLSSIYSAYPQITTSAVDFQAATGTFYYLNSDGAVARVPDKVWIVQSRASMQAPDGTPLYDGVSMQALDAATMPSETGMKAAIEQVAKNLTALAAAPAGTAYVGPVLFEPRASAQVFAEIFGGAAAVTRRPVADPNRPLPFAPSEFEGRLGSRVLPEWMDVSDDPTRTEWNGRPLLGTYRVDLEGQVPKPLALVEKGILKSFLTTRTPVRGSKETNGRARLPGAFGSRSARFSNMIVSASNTISAADLKKMLIEMIQAQNKPYGMLVRKMDFPSSAMLEDVRRLATRLARSGGSGRMYSSPVLVYKVFPDGREELVRGLRFRSFAARAFRDIAAASNEMGLFDYLENGAPFSMMGAGNFVVGCAVVAPGILFEELELERPEDELPKLPIVPPPSL